MSYTGVMNSVIADRKNYTHAKGGHALKDVLRYSEVGMRDVHKALRKI